MTPVQSSRCKRVLDVHRSEELPHGIEAKLTFGQLLSLLGVHTDQGRYTRNTSWLINANKLVRLFASEHVKNEPEVFNDGRVSMTARGFDHVVGHIFDERS